MGSNVLISRPVSGADGSEWYFDAMMEIPSTLKTIRKVERTSSTSAVYWRAVDVPSVLADSLIIGYIRNKYPERLD